jgi:hypothetical protein
MNYIKTYESFNDDFAFELALDKALNDETNEEFGISALVGTLLASGKFVELLGKLGKWTYNKLVDKGIIDGKKIEKTKFEKAGEWIQKIIDKVFLLAAKGIGKVFNLSDDNVEKLAQLMFYISLVVLGTQGIQEIAQAHGGSVAILVEEVAVAIKGLELAEVLLALILMMSVEELKKQKLKDVAHTMVKCVKDGNLKKLFKKDSREQVVACTVKNVSAH